MKSVCSVSVMLCVFCSLALAGDGNWIANPDVDSNLSDPSNWSNGQLPDGTDTTAYFRAPNNSWNPITVDNELEFGHMKFYGEANWYFDYDDYTQIKLHTYTIPSIYVASHANVSMHAALYTWSRGLEKLGNGRLSFVNQGGIHGGPFHIRQGEVEVSDQGSLGLPFAEDQTVIYNGAALQISGGSSGDTNVISEPFFVSGNGYLGYGALRINEYTDLTNTITVQDDAYITKEKYWRWGNATISGDILLNNQSQLQLGVKEAELKVTGSISGDGSLLKTGSRPLELTGTNTYTGGTKIDDGRLTVWADENLGQADAGIVFDGGKLEIQGEDYRTTNRPIEIRSGGADIDVQTEWNTLTLESPISGSGGLEKSGAGGLRLNAANTFSGPTTVTGGNLYVNHSHALQNSTIELSSWVRIAPTDLHLGGITGWQSFDFAQGTVLTVGYNNESTEYSGGLSGRDMQLVKVGDGTLTLSWENDFDAGTTIRGGAISVSDEYHLGMGSLTFDGGQLKVTGTEYGTMDRAVDFTGDGGFDIADAAHTLTIETDLTGTGNLAKRGPGTLQLTGDNDGYSGDISIYEGTLRAGIHNSLHWRTGVDIADGAVFLIDSSEDFGSLSGAGLVDLNGNNLRVGLDGESSEFSGLITGEGLFRKGGSGTFTLSGANDYSSGTDLQNGMLIVAHDSALGTGSVSFNGGDLMIAEGITISNTLDLATDIGGALLGTGTILGDVDLGDFSSVSPGASPGLLTIDGDFSMVSGSILEIEIAGLTRGDLFDALVITGEADFGGLLDVVLLDGFLFQEGDVFDILDWGTLATGSEFETITLPSLDDPMLNWDISNLYVDGTLAVVPEPASLCILMLGGLVVVRRR